MYKLNFVRENTKTVLLLMQHRTSNCFLTATIAVYPADSTINLTGIMSTNAALHLNDVTYSVNHKRILSDISLVFQCGRFHGVLGPNGAGKTTLLKIITGQLEAEGQVHWQGKTLSDYAPQELARHIAVVNQINDSVFSLTASQVVTMGLLPHKHLLSRYTRSDREQVAKALDDVGLADKAHQHFSALSGGEQQRCLIARALVQGAPLLVLDEPVNHLDVYYQHQILHLLHSLCQQQGKTVVVSLHDLNLAAAYCDNLVLMQKGLVAAAGAAADVLEPGLLGDIFRVSCTVHRSATQATRIEFTPPFAEYHCDSQRGKHES